MSDETSVLVFGMDELASAVARKLQLENYAVALHQPNPPGTIRRRMSFADAWYDGSCMFEGVEARRADKSADFLSGLRSGMFVPVLGRSFEEVTDRWPWDVLVDARPYTGRGRHLLRELSETTIGLGRGFRAGDNCDIVIDIGGSDPGAVIREGGVPESRDDESENVFVGGEIIEAPAHGLFHGSKLLGELVETGDILGWMGATPIKATTAGRLRGLIRDGIAVKKGAEIAEIVAPDVECVGITKRDRLIARSVAFVIEMERSGYTPISLENLF
jgi:xanthine dehydrogenase accessory factor